MRDVTLFAILVLTACVSDPESMAQQTAGSVCTGQLYDACTSNDQCESGTCKLYSNRMVQVCTQLCDASNPCPDQDGTPVTCNNMGLCRPDAANMCGAP